VIDRQTIEDNRSYSINKLPLIQSTSGDKSRKRSKRTESSSSDPIDRSFRRRRILWISYKSEPNPWNYVPKHGGKRWYSYRKKRAFLLDCLFFHTQQQESREKNPLTRFIAHLYVCCQLMPVYPVWYRDIIPLRSSQRQSARRFADIYILYSRLPKKVHGFSTSFHGFLRFSLWNSVYFLRLFPFRNPSNHRSSTAYVRAFFA
jgi:hypothetical protein